MLISDKEARMKKVIAMFLCLTVLMSITVQCKEYGGTSSYGDFYSFSDRGKFGDNLTARRTINYIKEIVENYYDLTGARVIIQMQLDDKDEVNSITERMLDKKLPLEEALEKYNTELIKYAHNKYPITDKWIAIGYYGATGDVYVAQEGIEVLSEDDILELKSIVSDDRKGLGNRMDDLLATIFYKLYNGLDYRKNSTTRELMRIYDQIQNPGKNFYILPFVVLALPVIGIVGYIVTKKKKV